MREALAAMSDLLAKIPEDARNRIVRCTIARIEAHGRGDEDAATQIAEIVANDLAEAKGIAREIAISRGLKILKAIAPLIVSLIPGAAGMVVGALTALIPDFEENERD